MSSRLWNILDRFFSRLSPLYNISVVDIFVNHFYDYYNYTLSCFNFFLLFSYENIFHYFIQYNISIRYIQINHSVALPWIFHLRCVLMWTFKYISLNVAILLIFFVDVSPFLHSFSSYWLNAFSSFLFFFLLSKNNSVLQCLSISYKIN